MDVNTKSKLAKIIKIVLAVLIIAALIFAAVKLFPWFISLKDAENRDLFKQQIDSMGIWGALLFLGLQVLQIVVAVLPGEPVEIIAGMLYGTVVGMLMCLIGIFIGSAIVYGLVKLFGKNIIDKIFKKEETSKFEFLRNTEKIEMMVFILFFIPGTPKDALTYFSPLLNIKPIRFFIIATIARIPSVITSTYAGASIIAGKWWQTVIVFAISGILGILGIWIHNKIINRNKEKKTEE